MKSRGVCLILVVCLALVACSTPAASPAPPATATSEPLAQTLATFEVELEAVRQELKIPGMSAAVVKNGKLVWARGLGYADVENQVPATPETPYHLASVTKTFAAVAIMQLVQEGKLSLDDPVSRYGVTLAEGDKVLVRHLMSHTSEGTPGARYQYNGNRYGQLSQVVLDATGRSLQEWVYERILQPLGMENTAPSPPTACAGLPFAPTCERVYAALTKLYCLDVDFNPAPGLSQDYFNAGAGLMSTVVDLSKFDAALDANTLVTAATKELMWTPTVSNSGQKLPYGLGWFTQTYRGTRLIWHSGFSPPSTSALFLKLPEKGLTLIVLANTDLLSRQYQAGHGDANDVLSSLVAVTFYKRFVLAPQYDQALPAIDWSRPSSTVLTAISYVQDEAVKDLLNKESQARRALANALADVKVLAERIATMRTTAEVVGRSLEPQTLDLYAGTYEFADTGGVTANVTRVDNRLYLHTEALGGLSTELLPLSTTRFFVPAGYDFYQLDFMPGAATGQNYRLVFTLWGESYTGWRK
jgi:CubicO group peptidase (beta-lactamase class C family)